VLLRRLLEKPCSREPFFETNHIPFLTGRGIRMIQYQVEVVVEGKTVDGAIYWLLHDT
jgi:hypothetical protein